MAKVTREQAEKEITSWLDKKKVFDSQREENKASYELLVDAMMEGYLTLDSTTFEFKHKLIEPLTETFDLTYKSRMNDKMVKPHLNGVKPTDAEGRLLAYGAALTTMPKAVLEGLDSSDKKIMIAILVFFL